MADDTIIGKTNGKNSSEHALAKSAIGGIAGIAAAAVAFGFITPDHAALIAELAQQTIAVIGAVVAAYGLGRSIIKSVIAYNAGTYVVEDETE